MLREGLLCRALLRALALGLVATALHAQDENDKEKLRLLTI
ncbi:MAG: hypothetical protein ACE5JM_07995 [Armatimonadota bacterium]